ncbi:MAG: PA2779 family protein [Deltaproteobacteria bacterium]|nr:PA2779 family protein [Deltaproteobacteria bacterium]MBW1796043.1 PA2779 family protein [Deltaproteobacteria bacterium]MBW2331085.1 PA2779 family protein [Deltaproteobacteria bacterium]
MSKRLVKCVSWCLVVGMFVVGIAPRVDAGFSPSEITALSQADRISDLQNIQKILETKMIRKRLQQLGFSQDDIQGRLSRLNDQQIHQIALKLDEIRVGGNGFEVLVVLLLIGILVGVWLHVSGKKIVVQSK